MIDLCVCRIAGVDIYGGTIFGIGNWFFKRGLRVLGGCDA